MLKKIVATLATCAFAAIAAANASAQVELKIAVEGAYPPFNMQDSTGSLKGFDVDIANALCEQMKVKCEIVAQDWDGMIPGLLTKKYDAIVSSMSITEPRKKVIAFTKSYYRTNGVVLKRKDDKELTSYAPKSLEGQTIAAQVSSIYSALLESNYSDANIRLFPSLDDAFSDLSSGRVAAVFADKTAAVLWLEGHANGCCEVVGPDITDLAVIGEGAGIGVRKSDNDLRQRLNDAISAIVKDGTYKKINDKYFPFDIY